MDQDLQDILLEEAADEFPESLVCERGPVEAKLVACLLKDPYLFDGCKLSRDDFLTKDGQFYFDIVERLRSKDIGILDYASIQATLSEEEMKRLDKQGGYGELQKVVRSVNTDNFPSYLDEMRREVILTKAWKLKLFSTTASILYDGKLIHELTELRKLPSSGVLEFFDTLIADLDEYNVSSGVIDSQKIEFDDFWLEELQKGVEDGVPFSKAFLDNCGDPVLIYPRLSDQIKGLLPGTSTCLGGYSSVGKSTFWIGILMALVSQGHRVLFISNEEKASRFKQKCLIWVIHNIFGETSITKADISKQGSYTPEQRNLIREAQRYWYENNLDNAMHYIQIDNANMNTVKKQIRQFSRDGFDVFVYDTFKIGVSDMSQSRTDLALVRDSRTLDELAKANNVIVLYSTQLAEHKKGGLWMDASYLSNAKQMKEIMENLFLMRPVYPDELDPNSPKYIRPYRNVEDSEHGWVRQPVQLDTTATWKVLFIEKCRSGANSDDMGSALLFRFDGDYATFVEHCWCSPRRGHIG